MVAAESMVEDFVWNAWRDEDQLVMGPDARLPDRCVKTDLPAHGRTTDVTLLWHEPAVYWLLVLNPLVYLVVARAVGTRVVVTVGITEAALTASRRAWRLTLALLGAGVAVWLGAAVLLEPKLLVPGIALMALAIPVYLVGARFIRATRLEGERVWIRGVSPSFLARLPELRR